MNILQLNYGRSTAYGIVHWSMLLPTHEETLQSSFQFIFRWLKTFHSFRLLLFVAFITAVVAVVLITVVVIDVTVVVVVAAIAVVTVGTVVAAVVAIIIIVGVIVVVVEIVKDQMSGAQELLMLLLFLDRKASVSCHSKKPSESRVWASNPDTLQKESGSYQWNSKIPGLCKDE